MEGMVNSRLILVTQFVKWRLNMGRFHVSRFVKTLGAWLLVAGLQAFNVPEVLANPPNGRMQPEERHRLRQDLRQHSGNYARPPMQVAPIPTSNAPPMVIPQNATQTGAMAPYGQSLPGGNPGAGRMVGPGAGRLSEDDRRALRQQLREQQRTQREPVSQPGAGPSVSP